MTKGILRPLLVLALVCALAVVALGDVIRMKDGQVIRGQIVGFRDQQFTVLIGSGTRGRRSTITLYVDDVDSIEFESGASAARAGDAGDDAAETRTTTPPQTVPRQTQSEPQTSRPTFGTGSSTNNTTGGSTNTSSPTRTGGTQTPATGAASSSQMFPIRVRVRADNSSNGWTDSGLMVRRGQRLRITASGRVSLGQGRFSTPTGLPRVVDTEKLMRNEPTGSLIAVVGDDNDEFIFIGASREFFATRDGRLFLGVNEGNLNDNTGTYDALIEVEPVSGGQ